jgi:hypothetical protein
MNPRNWRTTPGKEPDDGTGGSPEVSPFSLAFCPQYGYCLKWSIWPLCLFPSGSGKVADIVSTRNPDIGHNIVMSGRLQQKGAVTEGDGVRSVLPKE